MAVTQVEREDLSSRRDHYAELTVRVVFEKICEYIGVDVDAIGREQLAKSAVNGIV
jgi:hypothetical protein